MQPLLLVTVPTNSPASLKKLLTFFANFSKKPRIYYTPSFTNIYHLNSWMGCKYILTPFLFGVSQPIFRCVSTEISAPWTLWARLRLSPVRLDWLCTIPRVRHSLILWLRARMLRGGILDLFLKCWKKGINLCIYTAKTVYALLKFKRWRSNDIINV